jgi:hypothetical protein
MVDTVQRVANAPFGPLAREALTLRIGEAEQVVEVERQDRLNGTQAYWRCPKCDALRQHLYVVGGELACRVCLGLDYWSRHVPRAVARAAKLRRKLGAAPGLLSPIPRKLRHWSPVHYRRLVAELVATEHVLRDMLGATVKALERRKGRLHGR